MAGLQSDEGRMLIGSLVWAQYINVKDTQTDSHVAIANVAPMHCVGWQKLYVMLERNYVVGFGEPDKLNNT